MIYKVTAQVLLIVEATNENEIQEIFEKWYGENVLHIGCSSMIWNRKNNKIISIKLEQQGGSNETQEEIQEKE